MLEGILLASTGLLALVTLLPLCRYRAWWIRVWEFPRLQLGAL
ncbi:endonuclease, partial [Stutzerimonas stutzeri]